MDTIIFENLLFLETLCEKFQDAALFVDHSFVINFVSDTFLNKTKYSRNDLINQPIDILMTYKVSEFHKHIKSEAAFPHGESLRNIKFVHPDGQVQDYQSTICSFDSGWLILIKFAEFDSLKSYKKKSVILGA